MRKTFLAILLFFIFGCESPKENTGAKALHKTYPCPQSFKTDVAWIVLEWNGKPEYGGYGSGFIINKEKGAFFTNKHVSDTFDALGRGSHKILFNCGIYDAEIVKTALFADVALVRITGLFDSSGFPDPAPFAGEKTKVGDKIVVEGFHVHPYWVRKADEDAGYKFSVIPIFRDYYNLGTKNLDKEQEVVFETLEAVVVAVDEKIKVEGQGSGIMQSLRENMNLYIKIKTTKDHKFPFSGLSGTVVRNEKGETIGIFTAGPQLEYDPETKEDLPDGSFLAERVFKTAFLTPIESAENLRLYLNER
ncbi:MAG: hypothetical protein A3G51_00630 [Candidatus Yanofskybacteria bacterium RIFCSPLOWO2_12_FULL_43_11b]|uniref:Serine protease n=1 Tax=Candidatus Yanofskybacteria bacterium RIFCSPLOWO2_12_FULL_43_11b TaxID=1802710 RepID=A0A1F8H8S3_9BACT|nr:MAG: hypothetical protein A2742_02920 [Candidatus Yanofskybacteria bacterium RIFCSPHIGHO2_01_FULL_43_32]OGN11138.1 MAG: hypothetical protein A3C69_01715 [Candidatus Yanofskybacteria bacterium RIFCSPHIGHO2_02_FULL_43_12]OGN17540.1 MAG: hypothetical protein A3E34_03180 [Candidatus Yanofskybacteria bacterium RIFCSPHIGHO2_12_FULL_43_11]OGN25107.1 MAG: hypothetical protein A2923_01875 [Candidatus Yanofskybacteria bacterium RIFCSPLOWO2_01_FULL_43_46]OGN33981.1 MAG: hypothetical protein A3G51_00630